MAGRGGGGGERKNKKKKKEKEGKRERKQDFSPSLRKACPTRQALKMSVLPEGSAGIPGEGGGRGRQVGRPPGSGAGGRGGWGGGGGRPRNR